MHPAESVLSVAHLTSIVTSIQLELLDSKMLLGDDAEGPVSPIEASYGGVGLMMMTLGVRVARTTASGSATT